MFKIFIDNFITFDFLIFILAAVTVFLIFRTRRLLKDILLTLKPQGYLPGGKKESQKLKEHFDLYLSPEGEEILQEKQRKTNFSYTLFLNITGIFPLMGILGTVISLIPMVNQLGNVDSQTGLFFSALTSTFWGIVFAIIFKGINGFLEAEIDYANSLTALYFERNTISRDFSEKAKNRIRLSADFDGKRDYLRDFQLNYPKNDSPESKWPGLKFEYGGKNNTEDKNVQSSAAENSNEDHSAAETQDD